jgi:DNA-binding NtrC family response regulator
MAPKILVVDRNEAFATMLQEMLEAEGGYEVTVANAGSDALELLDREDFDLTIVDMDLEDMGYHILLQNVRQVRPTMRLVLIPLMGKDLPPEASQVGIQGILSKPFFADDLLPNIRDALAKNVSPTATQPSPAPASPPPQPIEKPDTDVQGVLSELARETQANTVLLIRANEGKEGVIAHASTLDGRGLEAFTYLIFATIQAAQAASRFLGQPDKPFEHNMFETKSIRLYIMALQKNLVLVTITPVTTPLGTIRHNMRRAGRILSSLALT